MTVKGYILLGLPELVGVDNVDRVLLAIDGALLKSCLSVGPCHRNRVYIKSLEGSCVNVVLHDTEL